MFLCGSNNCGQLGEHSNSQSTWGDGIICPPCKSHFNINSLLSISIYFDHSVIVDKKWRAFAIGNNKEGQISPTLPKEVFYKETEIQFKDSDGNKFKFISAVAGEQYTLYHVQKIVDNSPPSLIFIFKNHNPLFVDLNGRIPVSLFGGHTISAAIDKDGSVIIITESILLSNNCKALIKSLPMNDKAIQIACCQAFVAVLGLSGRVYISPVANRGENVSFTEVKELSGISISSISGKYQHCIAVSKDGRAFGRGNNANYRLALDKNESPTFIEIKPFKKKCRIVAAEAGFGHSFFTLSDGKVFACGSNFFGHLLMKKASKNVVNKPIEVQPLCKDQVCIAGYCVSAVMSANQVPPNTPNLPIRKKILPKYQMHDSKSDLVIDTKSGNTKESKSDLALDVKSGNTKESKSDLVLDVKSGNINESKSDLVVNVKSSEKLDKKLELQVKKNRKSAPCSPKKKRKSSEAFDALSPNRNFKSDESQNKSKDAVVSQEDDVSLNEIDDFFETQEDENQEKIEKKKPEIKSANNSPRKVKLHPFASDEHFSKQTLKQEIKASKSLSVIETSQPKIRPKKDDENDSLKAEIEELKKKLEEKETEVSELTKEKKLFERKEKHYQNRIKELEETVDNYILDVKEKQDQIKTQKKSLKNIIEAPIQIFNDQSLHKVRQISCTPTSEVNEVFNDGHFVQKNILSTANVKKEGCSLFIEQCESIIGLNCPNIVKIFGIQTNRFPPSIFMELCSSNLKQKIKILFPDDRIRIIKDICCGMKELHKAGIIHGNLKLENVLLDDENNAKLSDFGFLTFMEKEIDPQTLPFIAPELVLRKGAYDEKIDVYAFGTVVLAILNEGKVPKISEEDVGEGNKAAIPKSVSEFARKLIDKCWSFNPADRPSFEEISAMLNEKESEILIE